MRRDDDPRMRPERTGFGASGSVSNTSSDAAYSSPALRAADDVRIDLQSAAACIDEHRTRQDGLRPRCDSFANSDLFEQPARLRRQRQAARPGCRSRRGTHRVGALPAKQATPSMRPGHAAPAAQLVAERACSAPAAAAPSTPSPMMPTRMSRAAGSGRYFQILARLQLAKFRHAAMVVEHVQRYVLDHARRQVGVDEANQRHDRQGLIIEQGDRRRRRPRR